MSTVVSHAFATLPDEWQKALWHCEVQGMKDTEAASLMGVTRAELAAIVQGARTGLREAYSLMLSAVEEPECLSTQDSTA